MPTPVLARRIAALETCRVLHSSGELDDQLEPIGKEAFNAGLEEEDLSPAIWDPNLPRPGTTKSRQYYYKRVCIDVKIELVTSVLINDMGFNIFIFKNIKLF